jgi:hypothetical protein
MTMMVTMMLLLLLRMMMMMMMMTVMLANHLNPWILQWTELCPRRRLLVSPARVIR